MLYKLLTRSCLACFLLTYALLCADEKSFRSHQVAKVLHPRSNSLPAPLEYHKLKSFPHIAICRLFPSNKQMCFDSFVPKFYLRTTTQIAHLVPRCEKTSSFRTGLDIFLPTNLPSALEKPSLQRLTSRMISPSLHQVPSLQMKTPTNKIKLKMSKSSGGRIDKPISSHLVKTSLDLIPERANTRSLWHTEAPFSQIYLPLSNYVADHSVNKPLPINSVSFIPLPSKKIPYKVGSSYWSRDILGSFEEYISSVDQFFSPEDRAVHARTSYSQTKLLALMSHEDLDIISYDDLGLSPQASILPLVKWPSAKFPKARDLLEYKHSDQMYQVALLELDTKISTGSPDGISWTTIFLPHANHLLTPEQLKTFVVSCPQSIPSDLPSLQCTYCAFIAPLLTDKLLEKYETSFQTSLLTTHLGQIPLLVREIQLPSYHDEIVAIEATSTQLYPPSSTSFIVTPPNIASSTGQKFCTTTNIVELNGSSYAPLDRAKILFDLSLQMPQALNWTLNIQKPRTKGKDRYLKDDVFIRNPTFSWLSYAPLHDPKKDETTILPAVTKRPILIALGSQTSTYKSKTHYETEVFSKTSNLHPPSIKTYMKGVYSLELPHKQILPSIALIENSFEKTPLIALNELSTISRNEITYPCITSEFDTIYMRVSISSEGSDDLISLLELPFPVEKQIVPHEFENFMSVTNFPLTHEIQQIPPPKSPGLIFVPLKTQKYEKIFVNAFPKYLNKLQIPQESPVFCPFVLDHDYPIRIAPTEKILLTKCFIKPHLSVFRPKTNLNTFLVSSPTPHKEAKPSTEHSTSNMLVFTSSLEESSHFLPLYFAAYEKPFNSLPQGATYYLTKTDRIPLPHVVRCSKKYSSILPPETLALKHVENSSFPSPAQYQEFEALTARNLFYLDPTTFYRHPHREPYVDLCTIDEAFDDLFLEIDDDCLGPDSKTIKPLYCFEEKSIKDCNKQNRFIWEQLGQLPSLKDLNTTDASDLFTLQVKKVPSSRGEKHQFAITLKPHDPEHFTPLSQRVYFLIDRSSQVEKAQFEAYKNAVLQAISHMGNNSTFNIVLFDNKVEWMSSVPLRPTRASINSTKQFLDKQIQGWNASFSEFSKVLGSIESEVEMQTGNCIAFLLSSGQYLKKVKPTRGLLNERRPYSLYSCAVGENNNLPSLRLLALMNRGSLVHAETHATFARRLASMVKRTRTPLAENLRIKIVDTKDRGIELFDDPILASTLYANVPYSFYGAASRLEDFDVIIQGYFGNEWVNMVKTVPLGSAAQRGKLALEKKIALRKALEHYHLYIQGDKNELENAISTLNPYDVSLPF